MLSGREAAPPSRQGRIEPWPLRGFAFGTLAAPQPAGTRLMKHGPKVSMSDGSCKMHPVLIKTLLKLYQKLETLLKTFIKVFNRVPCGQSPPGP